MVDREKLREILRRADAARAVGSSSADASNDIKKRRAEALRRAGLSSGVGQGAVPSAQDDARERRRQALERAGLVEPSQPKTERPPAPLAVEAAPTPQIPEPSPQDVVQAPARDWSPILTVEEIRILRDALGWSSTEGPEELGEEDLLEGGGGDDVENVLAQGVPASGGEEVQDDGGAEPIEPPPVPADATADATHDEEEIRLTEDGEKLLETMRAELADLPNPFERMEAGELNYSFADKQKEIERRVAKIAAEVLKKFGAANGKKLKELEAIVQQITDELLDKDEAKAAFYLVDVLKRGRKDFDVVLDEQRMLDARERLFWRGEVQSLGAGRDDFEALSYEFSTRRQPVFVKLLKGIATEKERQFLNRYNHLISQENMKSCYTTLLSEGKITRCMAMLAFVKYRSENKFYPIYSPDLLSFETNPDFKQKFEELYRGAIQRLKGRIASGEVKIDTSDDRAVKEALRPYSDFAVANGVLGFDWKQLCKKFGVS